MVYKMKEIREQRGLTQEELAKRSGISRKTVWALERNSDYITTTKTLTRIADALNTTVDALFLPKVFNKINSESHIGTSRKLSYMTYNRTLRKEEIKWEKHI